MSLTPGTRLGPYEVVEPLGAGAMGEVYHARDTRLNRAVALKVLQSRGAVERLNLLGTPAVHKRHVLFDEGHIPRKNQEVVREILDWLDKYLGPVPRGGQR
jgi:serine/threonine protein kinase